MLIIPSKTRKDFLLQELPKAEKDLGKAIEGGSQEQIEYTCKIATQYQRELYEINNGIAENIPMTPQYKIERVKGRYYIEVSHGEDVREWSNTQLGIKFSQIRLRDKHSVEWVCKKAFEKADNLFWWGTELFDVI